MSTWENVLGAAAVAGLVLAFLTVAAVAIGIVSWLEERGKLSASERGTAGTAAGAAAQALQQILQPPARHVAQAKQGLKEKANRESGGGPKDPDDVGDG